MCQHKTLQDYFFTRFEQVKGDLITSEQVEEISDLNLPAEELREKICEIIERDGYSPTLDYLVGLCNQFTTTKVVINPLSLRSDTRRPSEYLSKFPSGSILYDYSSEQVIYNCLVILAKTGNTFRPLTFEEYQKVRKEDGCFSINERPHFDRVQKYLTE